MTIDLTPRQREVVARLAGLLVELGSANDAEDHGFAEQAQQMRTDACVAMLTLMMSEPFLNEMFPALRAEVESGRIGNFGWSTMLDRVRGTLRER